MSAPPRKPPPKALYILPNLFTTLSLMFSFWSIMCSVNGRFLLAALAILISGLCDALDGAVARMTGTPSNFGVEYDSLCDLVAFGVAPALMVYLWALTPEKLAFFQPHQGRLGAAVAFIYLACVTLRLARFNVSSGTRDPGFFQGFPSSGGAAMLSAAVLWHQEGTKLAEPNGPFMLGLTLALGLLMVSSLDYLSHKNKSVFKKNKYSFESLAAAVVALAIFIINIKLLLWPVGLIYLLSGPVVTAARRARRKSGPKG